MSRRAPGVAGALGTSGSAVDLKVRYHGLAKNGAQAMTLLALANMWMARRRLLATAG